MREYELLVKTLKENGCQRIKLRSKQRVKIIAFLKSGDQDSSYCVIYIFIHFTQTVQWTDVVLYIVSTTVLTSENSSGFYVQCKTISFDPEFCVK